MFGVSPNSLDHESFFSGSLSNQDPLGDSFEDRLCEGIKAREDSRVHGEWRLVRNGKLGRRLAQERGVRDRGVTQTRRMRTKRKLRWKPRVGTHPVLLSCVNLPIFSLTPLGVQGCVE